MKLSIVIPAYNEAERLPAMLMDMKSFLENSDIDSEVIIVNDGSKDNTVNVIKDFFTDLHNGNIGYLDGHAVIFDYAGYYD